MFFARGKKQQEKRRESPTEGPRCSNVEDTPHHDRDSESEDEMQERCCPKVIRPKCCMKYPKDITESRGFQNLLKCIMKNSPGIGKCEAIKQAKCTYKNFREFEKCKYRHMGCKCPEKECCPMGGGGGPIKCTVQKKKPCIKCPCDRPRPCKCKLKPPNPCAKGRQCDQAMWMEGSSLEETLQNALCGPVFCYECGGAYLGEDYDELGCGCLETQFGNYLGTKNNINKSLGFRNYLKMFQGKFPQHPRDEMIANASAIYSNFDEAEKNAFRDMGNNPRVCQKLARRRA